MREHEGLSSADFDTLFEPLTEFNHLLLAVSGGVDSSVLLHAVCRWAHERQRAKIKDKKTADKKSPILISVACVDHGLRDGSAQEARAVKRMAQALGCECVILRWRGEKPVTGLQEKARIMRYGLLYKHAHKIGAQAIVLAHHADDQAETLLMRMAAGSGPEGLCGMQARVERDGLTLMRPFLSVPKGVLLATAQAVHLTWHEDPSNQQERFGRVRMRRMQALREAAGLTSARLGRLAVRLTRQQEAIDWMVDQNWLQLAFVANRADPEKACVTLQAALWVLPAEVGIRLIARAVQVLQPEAVLRLERVEVLLTVLQAWVRAQQKGRRTLGGCVLNLSREGVLTITPEPVRYRGRQFKE